MNYNYYKLRDTWVCETKNVVENYEDPVVSMSLLDWNQYVADGKNVMYPAIKTGRVRVCPYCKMEGGCSCGGLGKGPNPYGCACGGGGRMIF